MRFTFKHHIPDSGELFSPDVTSIQWDARTRHTHTCRQSLSISSLPSLVVVSWQRPRVEWRSVWRGCWAGVMAEVNGQRGQSSDSASWTPSRMTVGGAVLCNLLLRTTPRHTHREVSRTTLRHTPRASRYKHTTENQTQKKKKIMCAKNKLNTVFYYKSWMF